MALEPIQELQLMVALITGIAGTVMSAILLWKEIYFSFLSKLILQW